jgi:hypothetical protein
MSYVTCFSQHGQGTTSSKALFPRLFLDNRRPFSERGSALPFVQPTVNRDYRFYTGQNRVQTTMPSVLQWGIRFRMDSYHRCMDIDRNTFERDSLYSSYPGVVMVCLYREHAHNVGCHCTSRLDHLSRITSKTLIRHEKRIGR